MERDKIPYPKIGSKLLKTRLKSARQSGRGVAITWQECEEFIRLRKSCPAMLEALEETHNCLVHGRCRSCDWDGKCGGDNTVRRIEQAMAKAKGE